MQQQVQDEVSVAIINGLEILSVVYLCDFTQGSVTPKFAQL